MPFSHELADRVRTVLKLRPGIRETRMFGGTAFLLNGNMLAGVWYDSLILRVGPTRYEDALLQPHVSPMDLTGRPMKGWVLVAPAGIEIDSDLKRWIVEALAFAKTLIPKSKDSGC